MQLKRTLRRTLERLGIAYTEERVGWSGSKRYGYRPVMALVIADADWPIVEADRKATAGSRRRANAAARERRADAVQSLADNLGVLADSRTLAAYRRGEIDEAEARRIGAITSRRHEATNYDELLARGMPKEDARLLAETII